MTVTRRFKIVWRSFVGWSAALLMVGFPAAAQQGPPQLAVERVP